MRFYSPEQVRRDDQYFRKLGEMQGDEMEMKIYIFASVLFILYF